MENPNVVHRRPPANCMPPRPLGMTQLASDLWFSERAVNINHLGRILQANSTTALDPKSNPEMENLVNSVSELAAKVLDVFGELQAFMAQLGLQD